MTWNSLLAVATWTGAIAGGLFGTYHAARKIYDDWTLRAVARRMVANKQRMVDAKLNRYNTQTLVKSVMHIPADERGRIGIVMRPNGPVLNVDTHSRFNAQWAAEYIDPVRERLDHFERLLLAAANVTHPEQIAMQVEPEHPSFEWPAHYDYTAMMRRYIKRPSHYNVLLGVTYDDEGNESPVVADMEDLIHVMVGGRSGFGKSNLEYAVARQLVDSVDDCRLAFIDFAGVTLTPLEQSPRVLWPTATDDASARAVLCGIMHEFERRKALFVDCPGVQKLSQYNALDDREPLIPWYLFLDETPAILRTPELAKMLTVVSEQARKLGMGIFGAGTTWHAKVAPEWFRVNFATRAAVYCSRPTSGVVLDGDYSASELDRPGQAVVILPSQTGVTRMLCPKVEFEVIDGSGPLNTMPVVDVEPGQLSVSEKEDCVLELHDKGWSNRQIEKEVFGYTGGRATERVRDIIGAATT